MVGQLAVQKPPTVEIIDSNIPKPSKGEMLDGNNQNIQFNVVAKTYRTMLKQYIHFLNKQK
jgi:hypothetical protein